MNKAYLNTIRASSCYPTFRAFVTVATVLSYIIAALAVVAGFTSGQGLVGVVGAVLIAIIAKVGQEVSLMIADIADATIDSAGHRNESAPSKNTPRSESHTRSSRNKSVDNSDLGFCFHCGEPLKGSVKLCPSCGGSLSA